uniref:Zinc finger GRF-type domain-containing protein n=1 Tax=Brassica oleracea var. oleracea TaxID=109376 RepID=A0A0D3BZN5_BRAOL
MDLSEERKHSKRQKDYINMLSYTCDSEYGIPRRCSCGGRIIDEVRVKQEYDTLPGKRFFTCANYEADGFHYRQPWVIGIQEQIESLTKRLEEAEEAQAKGLTRQVDRLTAEVYNLTVQVADLEKLCFE